MLAEVIVILLSLQALIFSGSFFDLVFQQVTI